MLNVQFVVLRIITITICNLCYKASHSIAIFILILLSNFLSLCPPSPNIFLSTLFSLTDSLIQNVFVVFSYSVTDRHGQCFAGERFPCKCVSDHVSCSGIKLDIRHNTYHTLPSVHSHPVLLHGQTGGCYALKYVNKAASLATISSP
jgi:hypothetical protein